MFIAKHQTEWGDIYRVDEIDGTWHLKRLAGDAQITIMIGEKENVASRYKSLTGVCLACDDETETPANDVADVTIQAAATVEVSEDTTSNDDDDSDFFTETDGV